MIWFIGISVGLIAPWVLRRSALLHAFTIRGWRSGMSLWALISAVTVPIATAILVGLNEAF